MSCSCRTCADRATAYMDGALSFEELVEVTDHLKACPPCAEFIEQIKRTVSVAAGLPCDGPCEDTRRSLVARIRAKCHETKKPA